MLRIDVHPVRDGVDEHADHAVDTGQFGWPAGRRAYEDDLGVVGVPAQQQTPGRLEQGAQRDPAGARRRHQCGAQFAAQVVVGTAGSGAAAPFESVARPQWTDPGGAYAGKPGGPEPGGRGIVLGGQPVDEVAELMGRLGEFCRVAGPIGGRHLAHDDRHGPAVHQQVVHGPDQNGARVVTDHGQPHQRDLGEDESAPPVGAQELVETGGHLVGGPAGEVEFDQRHLALLQHNLNRLVDLLPDDGGAQGGVRVDDGSPCGGEAPLSTGPSALNTNRSIYGRERSAPSV